MRRYVGTLRASIVHPTFVAASRSLRRQRTSVSGGKISVRPSGAFKSPLPHCGLGIIRLREREGEQTSFAVSALRRILDDHLTPRALSHPLLILNSETYRLRNCPRHHVFLQTDTTARSGRQEGDGPMDLGREGLIISHI